MYELKDNIVALATTPGNSALNIIRLSGNDNIVEIFKKLTKKKSNPVPNTVFPYYLYDNSGKIFEQAIVSYFKSPKSYTGENMLEISSHGGYVVANKIIKFLISNNFRLAKPGEFSFRAFINNKINLIQAEAVNGIINSQNSSSLSYQVKNLTGGLSNIVEKSYNEIKNLLILAEHEIDFSEDEITLTQQSEYISILKQISKKIHKTIENAYYEELNDLPRVVIVGKPNAGKSSLFNRIVGYERAIVTNIKGTTRDVIEVRLSLNGKSISLLDTAGIRKTQNKIEEMGIEKTNNEISNCNIALVVDEKDPAEIIKNLKDIYKNIFFVPVLNKCDIKKNIQSSQDVFQISCTTKDGINQLLTWLSTKIEEMYKTKYSENNFLINERQNLLLTKILSKIKKLAKSFEAHQDLVFLSSDLRDVLAVFNDLIRPLNNDDILNEIFGGFCVGK